MAISQSITVLPTPPSRADPDNFDARADAFLSALPTMQTQMNTWAGQANTTAAEIGIVSEGLLSVTPGANKVPQADGDGELALGWLDLTGYAPAAQGVTNGNSHDHSGGDGAQIAYANLSGTPTLGTAAAAATTDFAAASHNQAETTITFTDVVTGNASTAAHGYAPKATAPASGLVSVLAIGNGETVRTDKALFDTTNPAALGSVGPGSAVVAARRDHVHAMPSAANVGAAAATSFIAGAGALTGPASPLTIGTAAAAATGDFAPAAKGVTNGDSHDHSGGDGAQIAYANLSGLPTLGKVLQVVGGASSPGSNVLIATDTWTDIGLAAAITPSASSSKILVIAHAQMESLNGSVSVGHGAVVQLLRGSTVIQAMPYPSIFHVGTSDSIGTASFAFLDSPATTSATTYKIQAKPYNHTTSEIYIDTTMVNYLVLLEIGA